MNAELVLLRIIPDPEKVGVVAQLISSERPADTAQKQIDEVVARLKEQGINASGLVKIGEVAKGTKGRFALCWHNQHRQTTNVFDEARSYRALSGGPLLDIALSCQKRFSF